MACVHGGAGDRKITEQPAVARRGGTGSWNQINPARPCLQQGRPETTAPAPPAACRLAWPVQGMRRIVIGIGQNSGSVNSPKCERINSVEQAAGGWVHWYNN